MKALVTLKMAKKILQRHEIAEVAANSGLTKIGIAAKVGCSYNTVLRWHDSKQFIDAPRLGHPVIYCEEKQIKLIGYYCQTRPFGIYGKWSLRMFSAKMNSSIETLGFSISKSTLHRVLNNHCLKPHRCKYYLHISDPNFFFKLEHLIQIYMNPPPNLFCFDESPNIQILQRLVPDIRTDKTQIKLKEFEYLRNGTLDLFTCLEVSTGKVFNQHKPKHDTKNLVEFLEEHIKMIPKNEPLNYIMDNLNTHFNYDICRLIAKHSGIKCPTKKILNSGIKRKKWLSEGNKRITFHFTPVHGSWLNMVEIWFGIIKDKCFQNSYKSITEMLGAIAGFTETWNTLLAHPFKWQYTGEGLHEKVLRKFIKILNSEYLSDIEVRNLTNQLGLIKTMYEQYYKKIEATYWKELLSIFYLKIPDIRNIIENESGPIRKKNAWESLGKLEIALKQDYEKMLKSA